MEFELFFKNIEKLKKEKRSFVQVTLVNIKGSAPQELGAKCLVTADGLFFGTVGGGKVEAAVISLAQDLLVQKTKRNFFQEWNLQSDLQMTCGGLVSFFFEKFQLESPWTLAVFGAGHVGQVLVRQLLKLDCQVICVDSREDWLKKLPTHSKLSVQWVKEPQSFVEKLPSQTFIMIMTMGHSSDLPILTEALKRNFPYVGNMGSETKSSVLKKDLEKAGISREKIASFDCPIGENIGNNSPIEIAFSIIFKILKVRDSLNLLG